MQIGNFCKIVNCPYKNIFGLIRAQNNRYKCKSYAVPECDYLDTSGNIKKGVIYGRNRSENIQSLITLTAWKKCIIENELI